jgi:hypothetical protein
VPEAEITFMLFDHFVGSNKQRWRKIEPERLCCLRIHNEASPGRLFDRVVHLQDLIDEDCGAAV